MYNVFRIPRFRRDGFWQRYWIKNPVERQTTLLGLPFRYGGFKPATPEQRAVRSKERFLRLIKDIEGIPTVKGVVSKREQLEEEIDKTLEGLQGLKEDLEKAEKGVKVRGRFIDPIQIRDRIEGIRFKVDENRKAIEVTKEKERERQIEADERVDEADRKGREELKPLLVEAVKRVTVEKIAPRMEEMVEKAAEAREKREQEIIELKKKEMRASKEAAKESRLYRRAVEEHTKIQKLLSKEMVKGREHDLLMFEKNKALGEERMAEARVNAANAAYEQARQSKKAGEAEAARRQAADFERNLSAMRNNRRLLKEQVKDGIISGDEFRKQMKSMRKMVFS